MVWIWDENNVDNPLVFSLLLSSAHTKPRSFQRLLPCQRGGWRCPSSREGAQQGQLTQTGHREVPDRMTSCWAYELGGSSCCPRTGWASVSGCWTTVLCITCFVYSFIIIIFLSFSVLLNCLYLSPLVLPFIQLSPPPHRGGAGERLRAAWPGHTTARFAWISTYSWRTPPAESSQDCTTCDNSLLRLRLRLSGILLLLFLEKAAQYLKHPRVQAPAGSDKRCQACRAVFWQARVLWQMHALPSLRRWHRWWARLQEKALGIPLESSRPSPPRFPRNPFWARFLRYQELFG